MPARKPPPERRLSIAVLRRLARAHTEVAVQVLAEVATTGNSEASRISAAMALLDRGYGRSGTSLTADIAGQAPVLYQRIELIDGIADSTDRNIPAPDHQD